jgi:hypothetical protein
VGRLGYEKIGRDLGKGAADWQPPCSDPILCLSIYNQVIAGITREIVGMAEQINKKWHIQIVRFLWPALLILVANLVISAFIGRFTFIGGPEALWKVPFRYFRFSLILVTPLFLLPILTTYWGRLFTFGERELIAATERMTGVSLLKIWLIRPFQGIGLSFLLGAKLIAVLQGYAVVATGSAGVLPPGQFVYGRMMTSMAIAAIVSLVLSLFWAMEDLGVSQQNKKTGEVRMIGKYLGVILPIVFGFAGYLSLLPDVPAYLAAQYVLQMVVSLYPPFVTLAVCHALYVQRKTEVILTKLAVRPLPVLVAGTVGKTDTDGCPMKPFARRET